MCFHCKIEDDREEGAADVSAVRRRGSCDSACVGWWISEQPDKGVHCSPLLNPCEGGFPFNICIIMKRNIRLEENTSTVTTASILRRARTELTLLTQR